MSILFAGLSSRQLPAMRIMTASPEDAYRHLYYYPPQPTTSSNSNVAGGGGSGSNKIDSPDGGSSVGLDNLEAVADDVINRDDDIDDDDDDSVDAEGFFFDSEDERKDKFQNGLWDDDQSPAVAVAAAAEEKDAAILESQRGDEETDDGPWVAQLLSYPNSGTSYTQLNTRSLTNRTTATTTGHDDPERRQPLRPDMGYNAPYVVRPDLLPESGGFVLTKTHCEGHCFTCRPASESTELFELQCRTAAWTHNRTHHVDRYGMDIVKKFVHLIRDPLDNCVSRMHHGIKNAPPGNVRVHEVREAHTDNPVAGLDAWCSYLDEVSRPFILASMSERDDVSEVLKIPCHAEFIRYVKWHNAAYKMTQVKYAALPTYRLYYENYTSNYGGVVRELYQDFLQYPPISAHPRPFIPGKTYHYMFSPQHQLDIKWLVKSLALPPVWEMLQHYFSDLRTFNYTNDGRNRSIALLVSFPNSVRACTRRSGRKIMACTVDGQS
jgi:Sulfotransferase domain